MGAAVSFRHCRHLWQTTWVWEVGGCARKPPIHWLDVPGTVFRKVKVPDPEANLAFT